MGKSLVTATTVNNNDNNIYRKRAGEKKLVWQMTENNSKLNAQRLSVQHVQQEIKNVEIDIQTDHERFIVLASCAVPSPSPGWPTAWHRTKASSGT